MMFNSTEHKNYKCESTDKIIYYLNTIIPLIWVIIGTITNLLSLSVFARRTMRRNSTFIYLAIMSFSDIILLWTSSFRDYLAYKYNLYINGDYACKIHTFSFFVFAQFSSWLLVGANLDRFVCVVSLNKYSQTWCSKRTAIKFAIILLFLLIIINSHFLVFIESKNFILSIISNISNSSIIKIVSVHPYVYPKCTLKNYSNYIMFYNNIYTWFDACLYCFLPFIIMFICNIMLIKHVFKTKTNLLRQQSYKNKYYSIRSLFKPSNRKSIKKQQSINQKLTPTNGYYFNGKQPTNDTLERMRNMAVTIVGVTILFIIFTVPINIYIPMTLAMGNHDEEECQDLLFSILNNMVNANHSINFFIYYITNSKFNKELKILVITIRKSIFTFLNISTNQDFMPIQTSTNLNGNLNTTNTNTTNLLGNSSTVNNLKNNCSSIISEASTINVKKNEDELNNLESYNDMTDNISDDIDAPLAVTQL